MYKIVLDLEANFSIIDTPDGKGKSDIATAFNDDNRVIVIGVYDPQTTVYSKYYLEQDDMTPLKRLIEDKAEMIIGQNIKYDVHWITKLGIETRHLIQEDTQVREYVLRGGKDTMAELGLDKLAPCYGGTPKVDVIKPMWKRGINNHEIDQKLLEHYLYMDVWNTWQVWCEQEKHPLRERFSKMLNMKQAVNGAVQRMEYNGIYTNKDRALEIKDDFQRLVTEALINVQDMVCRNVAPLQIVMPPKDISSAQKLAWKKKQPDDVFIFDTASKSLMLSLIFSLEFKPDLYDFEYVTKPMPPKGEYMALRKEMKDLNFAVGEKRETDVVFVKSVLVRSYKKEWGTVWNSFRTQADLDRAIPTFFNKTSYGFKAKPMKHKDVLTKTGFSTGKAAIAALIDDSKQPKKAKEFIDALQKVTARQVWISNNINPMIYNIKSDGCVHANFNVTGTASGRFSSSNPNVQNLPSKKKNDGLNTVRSCAVSRFGDEGVLVAIDYSQVELRYVMELTNCTQGIEDYTKGQDMHASTARAVYDEKHGEGAFDALDEKDYAFWRGEAKTVNFGLLYGARPKGEVQEALEQSFFSRYPEVRQWHEELEYKVGRNQSYTNPITGWCYNYKGATSENMWRGFTSDGRGWRNRVRNYPVQGGANEIIQVASIEIDNEIKYMDDILIIGQVHDELVFDVKKKSLDKCLQIGYKHMQDEISNHYQKYFGYELRLPFAVEAEVGDNWFDMKEIK